MATSKLERWHIVPVGDLRDHEQSPDCWCTPDEHPEEPDVWVHNSMDRREEYEQGRMKH